MKNEKLKRILIASAVGIIVLLIIALLISTRSCTRRGDTINMYEAINDTLVTYKNKYNQEVAKISIIEAQRTKDFLKIKSADSSIIALQKLVKEQAKKIKNGSAAIIETITVIHDTIQVQHKGDTIYFEDINEWNEIQGQIISDELTYDLIVKNKFDLIFGEEKGVKYGEFVSKNPRTHTEVLRIYQTTPKKKHFGFGFNVGVGGGYDIIHKRAYFGPGGNIGINYNF